MTHRLSISSILISFFFEGDGYLRDLHVRAHSCPTRRSADLFIWHNQHEIAARESEPVLEIYQAMTRNLSEERFRHWSVEENGLDLYIVIKSNERDDNALAQLETELDRKSVV